MKSTKAYFSYHLIYKHMPLSPYCCTSFNVKMALGSSSSEENISLSDYTHGLAISDKRRYLEKISTCEVDPYCIPYTELSKDILPPVQCTDIFNYLVLGKSFCSSQQFKAFKCIEAYKYFECGFVNCLENI